MQRSRRTNPYPFMWEVPFAAGVGVVLALLLGVQLGRAGANLAAGVGWTFPPSSALFTSVVSVLRGDADAGLIGQHSRVASAMTLWFCVAISECVVVLVVGWVAKVGLGRWGPGRLRGMASRTEAEMLLGRRRLRSVSSVVRPDLYGRGDAS